ncbi:hypothetical protein [Candidatus Hecatella orcuttiae]|uniref:hypothetical protein n=1 Tax=Candidatus Hecatella orcuttiae TaxID=1935119 RepID=UPI002867CC28|nr:hypothetical protein [Candidatus Hecatella orcuttiae]
MRIRLVDSSTNTSRIVTSRKELEETIGRRVCWLALKEPSGYRKVYLHEVTRLENEEEVYLMFPVRGGTTEI